MTRFLASLLFCLVFCGVTYAQSLLVTGKVIESDGGAPITGARISIKNSASATTSDANGIYQINADANAVLVVTAAGYKSRELPVASQKQIDVSLEATSRDINEVVIVAFGKQKRESVVGAQSSVRVEELKAPVRDLTTAIAGKIAGIIATQRGGGPGQDGADLFIRGISTFASSPQGPLLVVDGVPERSINNIDPEDVESFTVLKDATATAVYGTRGANGVIIITTKKGKAGKPSINVEVNSAYTRFTRLPKFVDGPTYMQLYNEGLAMRGLDPYYTPAQIEKTATGADPDLYPNVNWFKTLFNDFGSNNRVNLNVSGGSDKATYYLSAGYFGEIGMFRTDNVQNFNSTLKYDRFNFTSNLKVNLTKTGVIDFGVTGYISNFNRPAFGVNEIFQRALQTAPHVIPAVYSNGQFPQLTGTPSSPYMALTQSGVTTENATTVRSNLRYTEQLDRLLKGLSATAMFSFDSNSYNGLTRSRNLPTYWATGRNANGQLITQVTTPGTQNFDFSLGRSSDRRFYTEAALNYKRNFGRHDVSGLLLFNQSDYRDATNRVTTYIAAIPYRQRNYVGRANYGFDGRYFAEVNFSYSGSDQFIPSKRYGFFPSYGVGWLISREKFFQPLENIISHLKVRYSYGLSGNAAITDPTRRFLYLTTIGTGSSYGFGEPGAIKTYTGYSESRIGGDVQWETSYRHNLGIEMNVLHNDLKLIVELFKEKREGILLQDFTLPYVSGFTIGNIPYANVGSTRNKGIDASLEYNKRFANSSFISFRGTFTYNENLVISNGGIEWRYPYLNRIGQPIGQRFGLIAMGLFNSEEEISNAPLQTGDVRVGDIRYKDLNGDGIINTNDQTAIGYGSTPRIVYGLNLATGIKSFDLSLFFQGAALVDFGYASGIGTTPFTNGPTYGNIYTYMTDRWTPENPNQNVFYPRLSTNLTTTGNYLGSTWWVKRADYIRLKQAELGYTVTGKTFNLDAFSKMRIFLSGTNLLTFSKWKYWDPELGDGNGASYPNITTYNIGFRLTF